LLLETSYRTKVKSSEKGEDTSTKNAFYVRIIRRLKQNRCKQKYGDIFVNIWRDITSVNSNPT